MRPEGFRLRRDLGFERVALVLSGGGALGAYEVGVFRALETLGLEPAIIAGVSVGATNAVVWVAHGFRTARLEQIWRRLRASSIGMRWVTLALRAAGLVVMILAAIEVVLTLAGSPELNFVARLARHPERGEYGFVTLMIESLGWFVIGLVGVAMAMLTPRVEDLLARVPAGDPETWRRWLGGTLLVGIALYVGVAMSDLPWPWRLHTWLLLMGGAIWLFNHPGHHRDTLRNLFLRMLPETRGRGLWRSGAQRRLIERAIAKGDPGALVSGKTHLILSACSVQDGMLHYFINWPDPSPGFRERIERALGEVVVLSRPHEVVAAAVASGTLPVLFEPVRFHGHDYLDAGLFSNQPLHAVVADGADAILLVLVSPSAGPRKLPRHANLIELGMRIQELANWRDLQTELARLPSGWTREGDPARVCVVEPHAALPGSQFVFDPANMAELIARGEADAWSALERAGWIEASPSPKSERRHPARRE
jgi:predicted acylesterase/phospholipase RssA